MVKNLRLGCDIKLNTGKRDYMRRKSNAKTK
jgi:hypothetical protein